MTLYEINKEIEAAVEAVFASENPETGEVDEASVQALEALQAQRDEKLEALGCYIKNKRAEADAIAAEEKALKARRDSLNHKADRLEAYVAQMLGGTAWDNSPKVAFKFRRSERAVVDNRDALPAEFFRTTTKSEPDLTLIKKTIKAGTPVEGAHVVEVNNISTI